MISVWSALARDAAPCLLASGSVRLARAELAHVQAPATRGSRSCLDCWLLAWHPGDIIHIQSIPTFPYFRKHKCSLCEKLAYQGAQGQCQLVWMVWWQQRGEIEQRPDRTNNEQLTRWKHRKDTPRKKTPVSLFDRSLIFKSLLNSNFIIKEMENVWRDLWVLCCPSIAFID